MQQGLSADEASKELGIGQTLLKRVCRFHGIARWPGRQVKSIHKMFDRLRRGKYTYSASCVHAPTGW